MVTTSSAALSPIATSSLQIVKTGLALSDEQDGTLSNALALNLFGINSQTSPGATSANAVLSAQLIGADGIGQTVAITV